MTRRTATANLPRERQPTTTRITVRTPRPLTPWASWQTTSGSAGRARSASGHRRDRIRDRDGALGHVGMQALHHAAVELDRAARGVLRLLERRDDLAGHRNLF